MADFELFNGTNLEEPDSDHRIAMNKPSLAGAFFVRWDNFKNLIRSFTVSKDTDQSISGNKTFTGIVNVQAPASDNNPVTLKYFNDNAGGGGGTLTFDTSFELTAYLTNPDREAGQLATCLDLGYEDVILRLSNDTTEWDVIEATVYATQEQAIECIETAVVMNPLRSAQQWVYNVLTRTFEELTTASKTIIGAINELKSAITDILTELGLKATQNTGVCARCRIYPADIVVDPIAMTVSVVTVRNGQNISASSPLRFFTDGDGVIHKWEFYAPITASFTKINGIWGFYINQTGQVLCDQTPWSDFATVAPIYRFYLNDQLPNSEMIEPVCYEAHTTDTSASDHEWMHAQGTIHVSGFDHVSNQLTLDANGRPTTAPNADGRNTVIALTTGKSSDDGLAHTVTNSTDGAQFSQDLGNTTAASLNATNSALFRIRTNDTVGRLSFLPATRFSFPWNTVNNSPQFITTLGVRTDVSNERWFVVFVYDFPDYVNGRAVKIVTATQDFTTYALATAYQWESIQGAYPTMRDKEIRPLYKEIYYCDKSVGATYPVECKYSALCSTTDIRTLKPVQTSAASGAVLASNVIATPVTGYAATELQSAYSELASNTIKGTIATHATIVAADTIGVWDSVGNVFKKASALAFKTYVKLGLVASEVGVTASVGYPATDQQSYNTNNAARVVKLESNETPAAIADTDNVRFKSGTGYYVRTLLAIKNYVKSGLRASEVVNDSTIVTSATVKGAFDNADCVAVTSLQDTDMIPFARANGAVSENKMVDAVDAKSYFAPSPVSFNVTTTSELVTILGAPTCPYSVTINLLQGVELPAILNTYALNILFVGRQLLVSGNVAVNGMRTGAGVISFDVILLIRNRAIITVSCFDIQSSFDIRFKDILSNWVDTQYNLKLARGVDSMVAWGANNLISTTLSYDSGQLFIDNDYYVVTPYGVTFVSDETELYDALVAEKETMQICTTNGITMSSISNVYAGNVWVTGRKITISGGLSLRNSSNSRAVKRIVFDAAINFTGDSGDGTCIISATAGIWHLTFRDLTSAKPIKIFTSAGAEIHITTRKQLTVAAGSFGTYSLSSDPTLDVIDDDIIVNTNIAIGATYAGPYTIANVPNNYIVDSIEIVDVTLTSFSLIPKFETSTDTYTEIANSQQRVTGKSIYIYNNKPTQTGLGLINNTKALSVYVLNTYGVNRRLVLSDYSGGWTNSTVNVKVVLKENK